MRKDSPLLSYYYKKLPKAQGGGDISIPQLSTQVPASAGKYKEGGLPQYQSRGKVKTHCKDGYGCSGTSSTMTGDGISKPGAGMTSDGTGRISPYILPSNAPVTWDELLTYNSGDLDKKQLKQYNKDATVRTASLQGQFPGLTQDQLFAAGADSARVRQRMTNLPRYDQPSEQTFDKAYHNFYRPLMNQSTPVTVPQILQFQSQQPGGLGGYQQTVIGNYGRKKAQVGLQVGQQVIGCPSGFTRNAFGVCVNASGQTPDQANASRNIISQVAKPPVVTAPPAKTSVATTKTPYVYPSMTMPINRTDVIGRTPIQEIKDNQQGEQIHAQNVAESKKQFISQGHASTPDEEKERLRKLKIYVNQSPNAQMDQFGNTSTINPNMTAEGKPNSFMGEKQQHGYDVIMGGLEAAGYVMPVLEGVGAGYNALRNILGESMEAGLLSKASEINPWAWKPSKSAFYNTEHTAAENISNQYGKLLGTAEGKELSFYKGAPRDQGGKYMVEHFPTADEMQQVPFGKSKIDGYWDDLKTQPITIEEQTPKFNSILNVGNDNTSVYKKDWLRGWKNTNPDKYTGFKSIKQSIFPDLSGIANYPRDMYLASKDAGKLTLPTYKDIFRMEPTSFAKDADQLSGRWWTDRPGDLKYYIGNKNPDPFVGSRLLKQRVSDRVYRQNFGENMPFAAKQKSMGFGQYGTLENVINSNTVSPQAARSLLNGFDDAATYNEVAKNPTLYNETEGIMPDLSTYKVRGLPANRPFSQFTRIEGTNQMMPDIIDNVVNDYWKSKKFGIPKKYLPFKEGGILPQYQQQPGTVGGCQQGFFKNALGICVNASGQTFEQAGAAKNTMSQITQSTAGNTKSLATPYKTRDQVVKEATDRAYRENHYLGEFAKEQPVIKQDKGYTTQADIERRKSYSQPYVGTNQNATTDDKGNIIPKHADTDLQGNVIDAQANRQRRMSGVAAGLTTPLIGAAAVMGAGEVLPALDAAGTAVYNWGAANPALQIFNAGMKTAPSWAPGLTGYSALGLGFGMQSANEFANPNSETRTSYTQAYNNPTLGNIGTATGHTLVNALGVLGSPGVAQGLELGAKTISKGVGLGSDILNSAYKLNPNAGKIPFVEGKPNWLTGWSKDYSDPTKIDFSGFSKFTGSIKGTKEVKEFEKLNKWWGSLPIEKRLDKTIGKYYMDESKRLINQAQLKKTGLADLFDVSTAFKPGVYADFVAPFKNTPNIVFKYGKEPFIGQTEEMVLNNNAFNLGDETIGLPFHSQNVNNRVASLMPKVTGQGSSFGITNKPDFEISRKAAAEMALKLRRLQKLGIHADWKGDNFMFNPETNKLSVFDLNMAPVENSGFAKRFASGTNKIGENAATIMKQNWNLSAKPPRKLNVSDFTDRNNRVKEAWEAAKNQQSGATPPPITAEQYRAFLKQQKLQQQAGDFLRTQGQPDPSIGGWSPINNPETNRMVGLAQYGKPQKLTNLDFVTSEQLMNDNLFQKEFMKQTKLLDGFGLDSHKKIEIAVNKTLDALKNNPEYNMNLGLERTLQRIMRGPSTYQSFSKDFRPEFLKSVYPLGSQAKGVMRRNPSGAMDANFSINNPNIKVYGDEAIVGKESVLRPDQISMRTNAAGDFVPSKILSIYQKQLSSALEKLNLQPFTGTNAFNMLTPNKEGGLTKFTNGGNVNIGQEMTVSTQQLAELKRQGYKIQML